MRHGAIICLAETKAGRQCRIPASYSCDINGMSELWFCLRHYRDHMYFVHGWNKTRIDRTLTHPEEQQP